MKRLLLFVCVFLCCFDTFAAKRIVKISVSDNNAPYEFVNEFGKADGFVVDIMKSLCDELDYDYLFYPSDLLSTIDMLEAESVDIKSFLAITNDRMNKFHFTMPLIKSNYDFVSRSYNQLTSFDSIKGKRIVVKNWGDI